MGKESMIKKANELFTADQRIELVVFYPERFVPNAYKWRIIRTRYYIEREYPEIVREDGYDAKRSHGSGPSWVAFSEKGGRLASA